jgi:NTE family protein
MKFEEPFAVPPRGFAFDALRAQPRSQTVTLGFLSQDLPATHLSAELAKSLHTETGASVLLVRLGGAEVPLALGGNQEAQATVVDWATTEQVSQHQFGIGSMAKTEAGYDLLTLGLASRETSPDNIAALINQVGRGYRYVLVEVLAEETPRSAVLDFMANSDRAFLFLRPTTESAARFYMLVRDLCARDHNDVSRYKPVLCLAESEPDDGLKTLASLAAQSRLVRDCPSATSANELLASGFSTARFCTDLRRLAREISGRLVGLALSSGAAKGFSHIGVIQVLEENGIEVDVVAGVSIGAYIGTLWSYGFDGQGLEKLAREMEARWSFWSLIDPVFPPRRGFLRGIALRKRLMRSIGTVRFADLPRPMRVIAGNLGTLSRTVFATGEVAAAVHASFAVPGICVPVTLAGESYIDGGIVDPVPVDILRELGVARVIAVNALPTYEGLRLGFEAEQALARQKQTGLRRLFRKVLPLDKQLNYFAPGNVFEILARSIHGAQVRLADASCRLADVVLRPNICDDSWLDVRNPGRFIALGRQAAERHLEQIKALVDKKEQKHEPEFARTTMAAVA